MSFSRDNKPAEWINAELKRFKHQVGWPASKTLICMIFHTVQQKNQHIMSGMFFSTQNLELFLILRS